MKRIRFWAAVLLQALGALLLLVSLTPLSSAMGRMLADQWDETSGGSLIVLSGAEATDGFLGTDTYWRCLYAVRAWRSGRFHRIYVSGATIAPAMKQLLVFHGVPQEHIVEETDSRSTHENAVRLKPLLAPDPSPKVLLTSDFHVFRARRVFAREGIPVRCLPVPDAVKRAGRWSRRWSVFVDLMDECGRIAYYRVHGWI